MSRSPSTSSTEIPENTLTVQVTFLAQTIPAMIQPQNRLIYDQVTVYYVSFLSRLIYHFGKKLMVRGLFRFKIYKLRFPR